LLAAGGLMACFRDKSIWIFLIAILIGSVGMQARATVLSNNVIHHLAQTKLRVQLLATVVSDPVKSSPRVVGSHLLPPNYTFRAKSMQVTTPSSVLEVRLPLRMALAVEPALIPGDKIRCRGRFRITKERKVVALFTSSNRCEVVRHANTFEQFTAKIRREFRKVASRIASDTGGLIPGLILGDTSLQTPQFAVAMRRSGLTHLTAVSGANFAIVAGFILWLSQWFIKNLKSRIAISGIFLVGFIFLVRPSPSVLRASVMTAVLLIAKARGHRSSALPALGGAIAILLLLDPFQALDPGFALSVAATAGILLLSPHISNRLAPTMGRASELISIPLAATLLCTPIIIALSGQFSLVTLPANLVVAPVIAPLTIIGLCAALTSWLVPSIGYLLVLVMSPLAHWIVGVAHLAARVPVLMLPKNAFGIILATLSLLLLLTKRGRILTPIILIFGIILYFPQGSWPGKDWIYANCDVGQGDASVINLGSHRAIVIDTGPDSALVQHCLDRLEIQTISLLILTHFHADHVRGILGALHHRRIGSVWVSSLSEPSQERNAALAALRGIPIHQVHIGQVIQLKELSSDLTVGSIAILWPPEQMPNLAVVPGDGSRINNSSVAILYSSPGFRLFAGGDVEPGVQELIFQNAGLEKVDVLKVSHHGSAYQYLPLMDLLHPRLALISVGAGNSYGHPSPRTIAALLAVGSQVYRTDRDGALAVSSSFKIRTIKRDWWRISWG
jgi:competence protein ComEC